MMMKHFVDGGSWWAAACSLAALGTLAVAGSVTAQPSLLELKGTQAVQEQDAMPPPDAPRDELKRGTPRSAVEGFYAATKKGDYARAAEYLDLRRLPEADREKGPNFARALRIVLDRTLWLDLESLSNAPEGYQNDGLPAYRERLGTLDLPTGRTVDVLLQRVPREDGVLIWKFSSATVHEMPALWDAFGYGPLAELLPLFFFDIEFAGFRLWQGAVLLAVLPLAVLAAVLLTAPVPLLLRVLGPERAAKFRPFVRGPLRLLVVAALSSLVSEPLRLGVYAQAVVAALADGMVIISAAWIALDLVNVGGAALMDRLTRTGQAAAIPLLPPASRVVKGLVFFIAGVQMLHNFGFNVTALLAGLGVGGIAVALAAQKTVENLIGGVTLFANQPVRVGDFCRFGDMVGTVEELGLYSTRVRTLERTVVTIPNAQFSTLQLDNYAKRDRFWYHPTIGLRYETTPDQIRYILVETRKLLYAHPRVDHDPARVRFTGFAAYALNLEIFAYVHAADFGEFLEVAEDLNLRIMDVVAAAGSGFAFPSQTTYLESGTGLDAERARTAEQAVRGWRERHELCLPAFPQRRIDEIDDTLEYPPAGSAVRGAPAA
jgi:MscS family membrane protein